MAFLVLIETGSNQDFIFASNRLRENVGASEIVRQVGMVWVPEVLAKIFPTSKAKPGDLAISGLAATERSQKLRMEEYRGILNSDGFEIVVSTSGKALVLFTENSKARQLIESVTFRALKCAPNLVVRGAIAEVCLVSAGATGASEVTSQVHLELDRLKNTLPPGDFRAPMWPILLPCSSTGMPTQGFVYNREFKGDERPEEEKTETVAAETVAKERYQDAAYARMKADLGIDLIGDETDKKEKRKRFKEFIDAIDDSGWIAIIHADGNGFGKFFLEMGAKLKDESASDFFERLREVSISLDLCAIHAARQTLPLLYDQRIGKPLAMPLVIGGDDLTIACAGPRAIDFTAAYLRAFEEAVQTKYLCPQDNETGVENGLLKIAGGEIFTACAGIAIVKPHFPYYRAYELSEALLKSAKKVKRLPSKQKISSLDYQVVFGDGAIDLDRARKVWVQPDCTLTARPYVVIGAALDLSKCDPAEKVWILAHDFEQLGKDRQSLAHKAGRGEPGSTGMPRGQQKSLRDALFLGADIAEARFAVLQKSYGSSKPDDGFCWQGDLFFEEEPLFDGNAKVKKTRFLDALEFLDVSKEPMFDGKAEARKTQS